MNGLIYILILNFEHIFTNLKKSYRGDMTVSFDLSIVQETSSLLEFTNNMNQSSNLPDILFSQSINLESTETGGNLIFKIVTN